MRESLLQRGGMGAVAAVTDGLLKLKTICVCCEDGGLQLHSGN